MAWEGIGVYRNFWGGGGGSGCKQSTKNSLICTYDHEKILKKFNPRVRRQVNQTSANNLTGCRYSKITQNSAFTGVSIRVSMVVCMYIWVGLEFVLCMSTILGYHYRASTRLRYQRFDNHLDDKPRVRTLIHRSLKWTFDSQKSE